MARSTVRVGMPIDLFASAQWIDDEQSSDDDGPDGAMGHRRGRPDGAHGRCVARLGCSTGRWKDVETSRRRT